jgi:hypothetical protein
VIPAVKCGRDFLDPHSQGRTSRFLVLGGPDRGLLLLLIRITRSGLVQSGTLEEPSLQHIVRNFLTFGRFTTVDVFVNQLSRRHGERTARAQRQKDELADGLELTGEVQPRLRGRKQTD